MATQTAGTNLICPHCKADTGDKVEDYVIFNRLGKASMTSRPGDCGDCDLLFTVELLASGSYEVTPIDGHVDDLE